MTVETQETLVSLRALLDQEQIDYYLVPSSDPQQSEYVPACWERRRYISGFSGSAGLALVGKTSAYLWTDGRYFLQAKKELDAKHWQLMRQGIDQPLPEWLTKQKEPICLGIDPTCVTQQEAEQLQNALSSQGGSVKWINRNLVDEVWPDQPAMPKRSAWVYPIEFAGTEASDKINLIRAELVSKGCQSLTVNRLDSIAWLLNIRGSDIDYNPLCISYLIITLDTVWWFVHPHKVDSTLTAYLSEQGVACRPYKDYFTTLATVAGPVWIDPSSASYANLQAIDRAEIYRAPCPVYAAKSIKNSTEIDCSRQAHVQDGLALTDFFYWLENERPETVTEMSAAKRLLDARQKQPLFKQESFTTISSFGANGAVIHYQPSTESDARIDDSSIFLLDSGGQYLGGTTDVTRCVHLGEPTAQQRKHYTLVLKAHLALRQAIFPLGTFGEHLDTITRQPLWRAGLDFAHGTGHGVGSYLCVHEGPQRIGRGASNVPLEQGMIVSNEPGLYFDGKYGIRIESLCLISEYVPPSDSKHCKQMLCLTDLTLFPYEKKLMDLDLLSQQEIKAINHYHTMVYNQLSPQIKDSNVQHWLAEKTNPIG
jgi:Xaa-Pro aminopeptidase